jgi:hypothetical protein
MAFAIWRNVRTYVSVQLVSGFVDVCLNYETSGEVRTQT